MMYSELHAVIAKKKKFWRMLRTTLFRQFKARIDNERFGPHEFQKITNSILREANHPCLSLLKVF